MLTCCEIQHDFLRVQSETELYHPLLAYLYQCLYDCNSFWTPLYSVAVVQIQQLMRFCKSAVCLPYLPRSKNESVENPMDSSLINPNLISFLNQMDLLPLFSVFIKLV